MDTFVQSAGAFVNLHLFKSNIKCHPTPLKAPKALGSFILGHIWAVQHEKKESSLFKPICASLASLDEGWIIKSLYTSQKLFTKTQVSGHGFFNFFFADVTHIKCLKKPGGLFFKCLHLMVFMHLILAGQESWIEKKKKKDDEGRAHEFAPPEIRTRDATQS